MTIRTKAGAVTRYAIQFIYYDVMEALIRLRAPIVLSALWEFVCKRVRTNITHAQETRPRYRVRRRVVSRVT